MSAGSSTANGGPAEGVVPPSAAGGRSGFLSDVLIELGFADRESVEHAVRAARSPGTTVARALVEMDAITDEQLARAVAERHGVAYVDLDTYPVDPAAANLIKSAAARRYGAVPIGFADGALLVAMADPADALGIGDIAQMSRRDVRPAAAARPALEALLERLPLDEEPAASTDPPADAETDALRAELDRARAETDALRSELTAAEERRRRLEQRLSELESAASAAERAFDELRLVLAGATPAGS